ncbi:MAG TPA: hypothetical protein VNE71_12075 [Myxococcota bacterium]|nr:hypothetical protein [Myxococcota bacterium]
MPEVTDSEATDRAKLLETEIERRLAERFAALRDEFDRLRMETDRRWFGFLEKFNQDLKGVVPAELVASAAPRAAGASRAGAVSIETARGLDLAATQVDVLHRFLDECRKHCSRAALLVARGGSIGAWKAVGFSAHGGDDDAVRQLALPVTDGGLLSRLMTGTALRLPAANEISTLLRAARVSEAVAIPMVVREKISGALYADAVLGQEQSFDPDALGLLTYLAGLVVDRLAARKLKPAPALRPLETVKRPEPAGMWMSEGAAVEEMPEAVEAEAEPGTAAEPAAPPEARPHVDEPPGPAMTAAISIETPAIPMPEPARRLSGPLAMAVGDERKEEARRFARLLISEIKLYNERAVLEGREGGNLYHRLKEDIDRSRQMYNERIPAEVRSGTDFFQEELVRILADGRSEALGI